MKIQCTTQCYKMEDHDMNIDAHLFIELYIIADTNRYLPNYRYHTA